MKQLILTLLLAVALNLAFAQKDGPRSPANTTSDTLCLACLGSIWSLSSNAKAQDNAFATVTLMVPPMCFQSTCYWSRVFIADDFGFKIPQSATVTGIKLEIWRCASNNQVIWDSIVQLTKGGNPVGINKASSKPWNTACAYEQYGDTTNVWSTGFKPSDINDSLGLYIKVRNAGSGFEQAMIDHIQITVFFSLPTYVEQFMEPKKLPIENITLYSFSDSYGMSFMVKEKIGPGTLSVYDMVGHRIYLTKFNLLQAGRHRYTVDSTMLSPGIYIMRFQSGDMITTHKVFIAKMGK